MAVLGDPHRQFGSSDFVRLEVEPKAMYEGRDAETRFYTAFFGSVVRWAPGTPDLIGAALVHARKFGLNALDALHVAAALSLGCDELVTTEGPTKPIFRVDVIPVVSICAPAI